MIWYGKIREAIPRIGAKSTGLRRILILKTRLKTHSCTNIGSKLSKGLCLLFASFCPPSLPSLQRTPNSVLPDFGIQTFTPAIYISTRTAKYQTSLIGKAHGGTQPPMLLDYGVAMMMELPDNFKELTETAKEQLRYQVVQPISMHPYEAWTCESKTINVQNDAAFTGQNSKAAECFC